MLAALALLWTPAQPLQAQERVWTAEDTIAAVEGQPHPIACIVYFETVPHWNPYSVGQAGELGPAQLHPQGMLPAFLYGEWGPSPDVGFRDPFDPWVAVNFIRWYGETYGNYQPWSTWRLCQ